MFGRPSPAAAKEPALRPEGTAASAGWRADGASAGAWTLRAATITGVRHRLAAQASEDEYSWAYRGPTLAVAVADGVGTRPGSGPAASRACRAAVAAAASSPSPPEEAVIEAVRAADGAAAGGGATTLVVAVLTEDGTGACGRVGDSTAFLLRRSDAIELLELFEPPDPERPDRATAALPGGAGSAEVTTLELGPEQALVLLSDGLADPWRDGPTTVAPVLAAGVMNRPSPTALLSLVDFSRQGCHDDRTIACLWRRDPRD